MWSIGILGSGGDRVNLPFLSAGLVHHPQRRPMELSSPLTTPFVKQSTSRIQPAWPQRIDSTELEHKGNAVWSTRFTYHTVDRSGSGLRRPDLNGLLDRGGPTPMRGSPTKLSSHPEPGRLSNMPGWRRKEKVVIWRVFLYAFGKLFSGFFPLPWAPMAGLPLCPQMRPPLP